MSMRMLLLVLGEGEGTNKSGGYSRRVIAMSDTGDSRSDGDKSSISKSSSKVRGGVVHVWKVEYWF